MKEKILQQEDYYQSYKDWNFPYLRQRLKETKFLLPRYKKNYEECKNEMKALEFILSMPNHNEKVLNK